MNDLLEVKFSFKTSDATRRPGPVKLPTGGEVTSKKLRRLADDLAEVSQYWIEHEGVVQDAFVSVHYDRVIAKSNRLKALLKQGSTLPDMSVCGARFGRNRKDELCHIITHYVPRNCIEKSEGLLRTGAGLVDSCFDGCITAKALDDLQDGRKQLPSGSLSKSLFAAVIRDAFYTESFAVDQCKDEEIKDDRIVTLYRSDRKTVDILTQLNLRVPANRYLDDQTVYLSAAELKQLTNAAPYLVAMAVKNWQNMLPLENLEKAETTPSWLPDPGDEPFIGVIDTLFDPKAPFAAWVTSDNSYVKEDFQAPENYWHGTEVCSLIVDGDYANPCLEDGCGYFRVKHFGVATSGRFSSFNILKSIREIVAANRQIKVWNLSLGSILETPENAVSPEAAELDRLQSEFDVIFVIAGTNRQEGDPEGMRVGAPADSINALVVNAVNRHGKPASYSRRGPVLHFFNKPDVCAYGGDGEDDRMMVYNPAAMGAARVAGTSYAAPWVTRKMAFLIYRMGLTREAAKALIIDAASGWKKLDEKSRLMGFGVVPRHIDQVVRAQDDEIRFLVTGEIHGYETYTYAIPVPAVNGQSPFFARATLCYFPNCDRNQGVDYTSTELDIHFGRTKEVKKAGKEDTTSTIISVNGNRQDHKGFINIPEQVARGCFRKWDNVKVISDVLSPRAKPRKVYSPSGSWGLSIKVKERGMEKKGQGLKFAVVVTLKEMNGVNRVDEFVKRCQMQGWIVNNINVENRLAISQKVEETVLFE